MLWLLALCEIVTYSTFNCCSASILVISIGVFCFRAELQIETTQDYATDSWFFNVFTGSFSLRTNSPLGVFARIHVTAVHERRRQYEGREKIFFSPPLVASPFARAFSRFAHQNWRTVKVLYGSTVSGSVQYSEEPSVILVPSYGTRERGKWPRVRLSSLTVSRAFFSRSSRVTRGILVSWGSRFCLAALTERSLGQALIVHLKEVTVYTLRRFKENDNSSNQAKCGRLFLGSI